MYASAAGDPSDDLVLPTQSHWIEFHRSPELGRRVMHCYDASTDKHYFKTEQLIGAILQANQDEINAVSKGQRFADVQKVASIPLTTFEREYMEAFKNDDYAYIDKKLNDGANKKLRTFPGQL